MPVDDPEPTSALVRSRRPGKERNRLESAERPDLVMGQKVARPDGFFTIDGGVICETRFLDPQFEANQYQHPKRTPFGLETETNPQITHWIFFVVRFITLVGRHPS